MGKCKDAVTMGKSCNSEEQALEMMNVNSVAHTKSTIGLVCGLIT